MRELSIRIRKGLRETPKGIIAVAAFYIVLVVSCAVQSAVMDRDLFSYDISMLRAIVCMSVSMRAIWLLATRAHSARWFCIFGTTAFLVLSTADMAFGSAFAEMTAAIGWTPALLLASLEHIAGVAVVVYLLSAKGLGSYFLEPDASDRMNDISSSPSALPLKERVRTWPFWRNTSIYFIVFSMLGHWAEILFCRLIILGVFMGDYDPTNIMLWDQWLFPFSAEGIALVMVVLLLHPLKERFLRRFGGRKLPTLLASFALNLAVCTSIDFLTGMAVNQDYSLWDYRALPFNFMGQVCLQNSLVYSIAATVIVWWAYPAMDRFLNRIPKRVADGLFFGLFGMYLFLAMLYFVVV